MAGTEIRKFRPAWYGARQRESIIDWLFFLAIEAPATGSGLAVVAEHSWQGDDLGQDSLFLPPEFHPCHAPSRLMDKGQRC
jgi:hypothetical protein